MKRWSSKNRQKVQKKLKSTEEELQEKLAEMSRVWDTTSMAEIRFRLMMANPAMYRSIDLKIQEYRADQEAKNA
jgi:hypothetical protein